MRTWYLAVLAALMAGCTDGALQSTPESTATTATPEVPDEPLSWFYAKGNVSGDGALELWFRLDVATRCTRFAAAHHEVEGDGQTGPWLAFASGNKTSWTGTTPGQRRIPMDVASAETAATGKIDLGNTVWAEVIDAYGQLAGFGDTFTTWKGRPDWKLQPGDHGIRVWANDGLVPDGRGETRGGSVLAAVGCEAPVADARAQVDDEPWWAPTFRTHNDVAFSTIAASVEQGSKQLETVGETTVVVATMCEGRGSFRISGAMEATHAWSQADPLDPCKQKIFEGDTGTLELAWDLVGGGWPLTWEVASWEPAEVVAEEPHPWPWD